MTDKMNIYICKNKISKGGEGAKMNEKGINLLVDEPSDTLTSPNLKLPA